MDQQSGAGGVAEKLVPEAGALLQNPSETNARALIAAINGKDLSGSVGGLLPPSDSYK